MSEPGGVAAPDAPTVQAVARAEAPTVHGAPAAGIAEGTAPATIGRFEVLGTLGAGGMGIVYRGFDRALDREVALKLVKHDNGPEGTTRLVREAQAMARVAHPNVVPVYEVGPHDGGVFVAMELVRGTTLSAWLAAEPRDWRQILRKLVDAGRGLAAVHRTGVLHRDFKPDNILIGEDGRARVVDFGLARTAAEQGEDLPSIPLAAGALSLELTHHGIAVGTPAFMSPEHFSGTLTPLADQWSFAVTAFAALFGTLPFQGENMMALRAVIHGVPPELPPLGDVPVEVADAILRGMQLLPEDRFSTLGAMLDVLEAPLAVDPETDRATSRRQRRAFAIAVSTIGVANFIIGAIRTHGRFDYGVGGVLIQSLVGLVGVLVGVLVFRRAFWRTAHDRRVVALLLLAMTAMSLHRLLAYVDGENVVSVLRTDAIYSMAMLCLASLTIERWFLVAAALMAVYLVLSFLVPATAVAGFGVAIIGLIVLAIWFWREPRLAPRGTPSRPGTPSSKTRSLRKS